MLRSSSCGGSLTIFCSRHARHRAQEPSVSQISGLRKGASSLLNTGSNANRMESRTEVSAIGGLRWLLDDCGSVCSHGSPSGAGWPDGRRARFDLRGALYLSPSMRLSFHLATDVVPLHLCFRCPCLYYRGTSPRTTLTLLGVSRIAPFRWSHVLLLPAAPL